jgi:hypothetical protein
LPPAQAEEPVDSLFSEIEVRLPDVSFLRNRMVSYLLKRQRAGKRLILRQNFTQLGSGKARLV